jgi:hypothetical protein
LICPLSPRLVPILHYCRPPHCRFRSKFRALDTVKQLPENQSQAEIIAGEARLPLASLP